MKLFKRGPNRLERLLAASRLQEAMERIEPAAGQYERVRTGQGRTAHLVFPPSAPRVLCGWPGLGLWVPAESGLAECRMCKDKAAGLSGEIAS